MLTIEEVRDIPLFAGLGRAELERVVRVAADIHLAAHEYAVHEGGERALFAVLSGKLEVVKHFDGIERTLGWRAPGAIFGEVPLAFATPFPGGYRAAEPSRVMRLEPHHYYAVAAASPEVAARLGALARERIAGLQGIAAQPPKPQVTMVGHRWDPACAELRRFLSRNQISHDWVEPDAPDVSASWTGTVPTQAECPMLRLAEITAAHGDGHLTGIDIIDKAAGTVRRQACGGLFVFIGADADTAWLPPQIARDARGYVLTGEDVVKAARWPGERDPYLLEASIPGVFACGDVRLSPIKRVAAAVGEGSMAIAFVHQFLQHESAGPRH